MTKPPPKPGLDAFHKERSKCLDAFATTEEATIRIIAQTGAKCGGEPFGKKIQNVRKFAASSAYPPERKQKIDKLLEQLETITEIRNDLVHARLQMVRIGDDEKACFINARECASGSQTARLFSLESLRQVTRKAAEIAEALNKALTVNPPSSPPPPSPGAAAAP